MKDVSDEYIVSEISAGKFDNLIILFDRYNNQLLNYYYRSTNDLDDSKDLTQDVFLRLMKYSGSFKPGTPFKLWLFKIAKNLLKDYYLEKQKHIKNRDKIIDQQKNLNTDDNHLTSDKRLFNAISKLPEEYRELIILSRFTKLKYSEIAKIHEVTEASIKNKLYRAIIKLRKIYFEITKTESHEM
jgi:RNA polymerase sigma factor (sigma-70 family)